MGITLYQIRDNADAFVKTIEKMTPKQKEEQPSGQYGDNFNSLLLLAKNTASDVDARLWPEPLEIYAGVAGSTGKKFTRSSFA